MSCSSCADCFFFEFAVGRSALGVGRFFPSFTGTSVIPHFGHFPGASITTSGCMTQVYFCVSAKASAPATIAITAINKINCLILIPELKDHGHVGRIRMQARGLPRQGISGTRRSVREHALLQNRLGETEAIGWSSIETVDFDRDAHRSGENV